MNHVDSRFLVVTAVALAIASILLLPGAAVHADPVEDLVIFTAGTTARADEVNGNFSAVADAVNDNDATITELVTEIEGLRATLEALEGCPTMDPSDEMVRVGGICIDRYEASIWDAPVGGSQITGPIPCNENGQNCDNIYARSVAGVQPILEISWFQAQQALANSVKRLPTNAEWQMAVAGTPDDGVSCNYSGLAVAATGSRPDCVSRWGTFDMNGNLWEWVADWIQRPDGECGWGALTTDDWQTGFCGAAAGGSPRALLRGGSLQGNSSGPFAVWVETPQSVASHSPMGIGFRGVR